MKPYSLRFLSKDLENKYQEKNMRSHIGLFKKSLIIYGLIAIAFGIFSFFDGFWKVGVLAVAYSLHLPIVNCLAKRGPKYFDFFCFLIQTLLNITLPSCYMIHFIKGCIGDVDSFFMGQAIAFLFYSFNLGSRFYLKVIAVILNTFGQLFIKIAIKKQFTPLTICFIGSNFMILYYMYWQDRFQRDAFLTKHNEKLWQSQIGSFSKISIVTCVSNNGLLQLDPNQCNKRSCEEFQISDQDSLKAYLNSFKLVPKTCFTPQYFNNLRSQIQNKNIVNLYSCIFKFIQSKVCESDFVGIYNSNLYDVRIFTTWNDQLLNIHTLISKSLIQQEDQTIQKLKYEHKLFTNFRYRFGITIKQIIVGLKCIAISRNQPLQNMGIIRVAHDALRLNYNLQLFLNPIYSLKITQFPLKLVISNITTLVLNGNRKTHKLRIFQEVDPNIIVKTCHKSIFHIIFNLFQIIIGCETQSGYIKITAKQRTTKIGSLIDFCISTDISSIKDIKDSQNYKKQNNYQNNSSFQIDNEKIGLELIVSEHLLSRIGPLNQIFMKDDLIETTIFNFELFQNLRILNQ